MAKPLSTREMAVKYQRHLLVLEFVESRIRRSAKHDLLGNVFLGNHGELHLETGLVERYWTLATFIRRQSYVSKALSSPISSCRPKVSHVLSRTEIDSWTTSRGSVDLAVNICENLEESGENRTVCSVQQRADTVNVAPLSALHAFLPTHVYRTYLLNGLAQAIALDAEGFRVPERKKMSSLVTAYWIRQLL